MKMAITSAIAAATPRSSGSASIRCSGRSARSATLDDLPQHRLPRLLRGCRLDLLASVASLAERLPARRQLRVLRLGTSVVRDPDAGLDDRRLLGRAADGGRS